VVPALGPVAFPGAEVLEAVEVPVVVAQAAPASRGALVPAGEAISGKAVAAAQAPGADRAAVRVEGLELAPEVGPEVVLDLVLEVDREEVQVAAPEGAVELADPGKEEWLLLPERERPLREDGSLPQPS